MVGERIMWAICLWAAGFVSAVIVGARNGEQMAQGTADILDTCDEMARADRVDCLARVEVMASAVQSLGERCVLSVPPGDNLRVARVPRGVKP